MLTIRQTNREDIPLLAEYWYDKMALVQQFQPTLQLLPDALNVWQTWMHTVHESGGLIALSGLLNETVHGGIVVRVDDNAAGLVPKHIGRVVSLVIDLHGPSPNGMGHALIKAAQEALSAQGVGVLVVDVAPALRIEALFWEGIGAKVQAQQFYLTW